MACCDRVLIDTGYIGAKYYAHEAEGTHEWIRTGHTCCLNDPQHWELICYCKARRWGTPPGVFDPDLVVEKTIDPALLLEERTLS